MCLLLQWWIFQVVRGNASLERKPFYFRPCVCVTSGLCCSPACGANHSHDNVPVKEQWNTGALDIAMYQQCNWPHFILRSALRRVLWCILCLHNMASGWEDETLVWPWGQMCHYIHYKTWLGFVKMLVCAKDCSSQRVRSHSININSEFSVYRHATTNNMKTIEYCLDIKIREREFIRHCTTASREIHLLFIGRDFDLPVST